MVDYANKLKQEEENKQRQKVEKTKQTLQNINKERDKHLKDKHLQWQKYK